MSTYKMDDGTIVKTTNATDSWNEDTNFDGSNHISVATGSQGRHQTLYRSRKGRYYIEHTSNYQGDLARAEWISKHHATGWLIAMNRPGFSWRPIGLS
jgi:hypothetical protein